MANVRFLATFRRFCEGMGAIMALIGASALTFYILELTIRLEQVNRVAILVTLAVVTASIVLRQLIVLWRETRDSRLARTVEVKSHVPFSNEFVTAVQLFGSHDVEQYGYSNELLSNCVKSAAQKARAVRLLDVVPMKTAIVLLVAAFIGCTPMAIISHLYPNEAKNLVALYWSGLGHEEQMLPVTFDVSPGETTILAGSPIEFVVALKGDGTFMFPHIKVLPALGLPRSVSLTHDGKEYKGRIDRVRHTFKYYVESGSLRSPVYTITVVVPPRMARATIKYEYPKYTAMPEEVQEEGRLDVRAPPGTKVTLSAKLTAPVTSAEVQYSYGLTTKLQHGEDGLSISGTIAPDKRGEYKVILRDEHGFSDPDAPPYRVEPLPDNVPRVYIIEPAKDLSLAPQEATTELPIKVFIQDDFGLGGARLAWRLRQRFEYTFSEVKKAQEMTLPSSGPTRLTTIVVLDLREIIFGRRRLCCVFHRGLGRGSGRAVQAHG